MRARTSGAAGLAAIITTTTAVAVAQTPTLGFTGPSVVAPGAAYTLTLGVDPSTATGDPEPTLTVREQDGPCGAGPGGPTGTLVQQRVSGGPQQFPLALRAPATTGRRILCAWLDRDGTTVGSAFARAEFVVRVGGVTAQGPARVTTTWRPASGGRCRVSGAVRPGGTGAVRIERRAGGRWVLVRTARLVDGRFAATFTARRGTRYRATFPGSDVLTGASSASHLARRTATRC